MRPVSPPPLPQNREPRPRAIPILITGIVLLLLLLLLMLLSRMIVFGGDTGNSPGPEASESPGSGLPASAGEKMDDAPEKGNTASGQPVDNEAGSPNENKEGAETESPVAVPGEQQQDENQDATGDSKSDTSAEISESESDPGPETPESNVVGIGNISGSAEFYGVKGTAGPVSFVIDKSSSMDSEKFNSARNQFLKSLAKLGASQEFNAFFYDSSFSTLDGGKLVTAGDDRKQAYEQFAKSIIPNGGTDPVPAVQNAVQSGTSCIFLLSDGEFGPNCVDQIIAICRDRDITVHTFSMQYDSATLKQIATGCGGTYRLIR